ncbi:MAG: hypothetical protein J6Y02_08350 [Pseudobutyrivibrio sp.]|nr:hypothetical protein [Pseudobutyrivibrio sp.]
MDSSMNNSILDDVKHYLGIVESSYDAFDLDLMAHINAAIGVLNQIGIGVQDFFLVGPEQQWVDFMGTDKIGFQIVQQYIYLKVRVTWDNSTMSSSVLTSYNALIKEYEYRLNVMYETNGVPDPKDPSPQYCDHHELTPDQIHGLLDILNGEGGSP